MAEPARHRWSIDAFFAWQAGQSERYELVDGQPMRMMAGATNVHDDIVVNILTELRAQLRGTGCRPFTSDGSVETYPGQIRRPDVGVDCGPRDPEGLKAGNPKVVIEVLSPSTRDFDTYDKLKEYMVIDTLDAIVLVEPNQANVTLWVRGEGRSWVPATVRGLEGVVGLPGIGATLTMRAIYEDVEFPAAIRLLSDDPN